MRHAIWMVGLALLLAGCKPSATSTGGTGGAAPTGPTTAPGHSHEGEEKGPHGGALFATSDHNYHLEIVVKDGMATLYLLDKEGKKAATTPVGDLKMTVKGEPPVTVTFNADPDTNDPKGETSRFKGKDKLPEKVDLEKATISGKIKGKDYTFEHE